MPLIRISLLLPVLFILVSQPGSAADSKGSNCRHYVFSWPLNAECAPAPRGGTSQGAPVTLDGEPSRAWHRLREPGLSDFERDRRAILAMAGGYRADFEFIETSGFAADYALARPYRSWGTEYVYVVEDRRDFISLQHIMVMFFERDGEISGPVVMKHWRQDWQYEPELLLEYTGNGTWATRNLPTGQTWRQWSQTVYQVDDSPRYGSLGDWRHNPSFSSWRSDLTWRPLPRRESSVRNDYQVLEGYNRHVITSTGWVQEEENHKLKLTKGGEMATHPYIARELGNNRYQRIKEFDFSAGDRYWAKTAPFWKSVREHWSQVAARYPLFTLKPSHEGEPLFAALFELAEAFQQDQLPAARDAIRKTINNYLVIEQE